MCYLIILTLKSPLVNSNFNLIALLPRISYNENMNDIKLAENERLDDLQYKGLRLIQRTDLYCFTSDAVILANTVKASRKETVVDFGCGNGAITILVQAKTNCKQVIGIEIQEVAAELAKRNAELNGIDNIQIINDDINNSTKYLANESIDCVVCNPPYFRHGQGETRLKKEIALSRHESTCTLEQIIIQAAKCLRFDGRLYMVHKCERLAEVLTYLSNNKLEPKELLLIYPKANKRPDAFVVTAKKGGNSGMLINSLVVYDDNGEMSEQAKELYNKI